MLSGHKNTRKQGDVGLGSAIAYFTALGETVCVPLTDSQRYDLITERDGVLKRVQVKTTTYKDESGAYQVALKTCGGNRSSNTTKLFDKTACELLFVLCEDGAQYLIPASRIECKNMMNLGKKYEQFKL